MTTTSTALSSQTYTEAAGGAAVSGLHTEVYFLTNGCGRVFAGAYNDLDHAATWAEILAVQHDEILVKRFRDGRPIGRVRFEGGRSTYYELS